MGLTRLDPQRVAWLDESSAQLGLRRTHGLAPVGRRLHGEFLRNHGVIRSLVSAMSLEGMLPSLLVDGSATREVFEYYAVPLEVAPGGAGAILVLGALGHLVGFVSGEDAVQDAVA